MKITYLKEHVLLKSATAVSREYIAKCNRHDPGSDPSATMRESCAMDTLLSVGNTAGCIDQLYFSIDMLSGYRSHNAPNKMNRYDYVVFGIENYYLRLTSVFDRCLRLANVIFQIGLPERQCNNEAIINNAYIKGTTVANALKEIDKFTAPFRFHRNAVAHHCTYSEKDIDKLGSYYYLEKEGHIEGYRYFYKRETDNLIVKKKIEFKDHLLELENLVKIYFDAIYAAFESRLKTYV